MAQYRILILDDERDLCKILKLKLETFGFSVFVAHDIDSGFQQALEIVPDCILLDIRLERGDGLTFLRRLRAHRFDDLEKESRMRSIPVIILTCSGLAMKVLFETEGISDYIEKPFDFKDLQSRILKAIEKNTPAK